MALPSDFISTAVAATLIALLLIVVFPQLLRRSPQNASKSIPVYAGYVPWLGVSCTAGDRDAQLFDEVPVSLVLRTLLTNTTS